MHDLTIITTLAGALAFALVLGWLTQRLGLSTLVGYMIAGVVVGPQTPGFVADTALASQMAEIGVILLMFGVGMHFHPEELLRVWRIAVPGAVAQSFVAAIAGWASARAFGWSHVAGAVFGIALAVASTVVLMRMLTEHDRLSSRDGHVAVGWLIVEDLFTVVALVVLPALAVEQAEANVIAGSVAAAIAKAAVFAVLIWFLGTRLVSPVMERITRARSTELFTLTVFVVALGVAIIAAKVFHVSVALGAFFAGLVVGQSRFGAQAAADMAPFRDVFSALFFVSVGMLFDPALVFSEPLLALAVLGIVLVVKPLVAVVVVAVLRATWRTALTVAVGLAQVGEFSFILAELGTSLNILPPEGMDALVVAAIISIAINPLLFRLLRSLEARNGWLRDEEEQRDTEAAGPLEEMTQPLVVAGVTEIGRRLVQRCTEAGVPVRVIDTNYDSLEELRSERVATVFGDPGRADVLRAMGVANARIIVVTNISLADKMRVCMAARDVNPRITIVATASSRAERVWLHEFGAAHVIDVVDEMTDSLFRSVRTAL
jgi:CPA2 family monovalent cation:H+ antiporter-2